MALEKLEIRGGETSISLGGNVEQPGWLSLVTQSHLPPSPIPPVVVWRTIQCPQRRCLSVETIFEALTSSFHFYLLSYLEIGSRCIAPADLELTVLLLLPPACWNYQHVHVPPHLAFYSSF
jgi:hypothetical protein